MSTRKAIASIILGVCILLSGCGDSADKRVADAKAAAEKNAAEVRATSESKVLAEKKADENPPAVNNKDTREKDTTEDRLRIKEFKITSTKNLPPSLSFSVRVERGTRKITLEECAIVCIAKQSIPIQSYESVIGTFSKTRAYASGVFVGDVSHQWAIKSCAMKADIHDPSLFVGQIEFAEIVLKKTTVPVSLILFDDLNKASNQLDCQVDFEVTKKGLE